MIFFFSPQNIACIFAIFLKHIIASSLDRIAPKVLFFQSAKSSITRTDFTLDGLFITTYLAKLLSPLSSNPVKGQIISKRLFGILEFFQKTNKRIRRSSKNEFVCSFFGRIRGYQKSFRNHLTFTSLFLNSVHIVI